MKKPIHIVVNVLGFALVGMGIVWILQGINVLPGSFMTGQIQWAYRGGVSALAGLALLLFAALKRKRD